MHLLAQQLALRPSVAAFGSHREGIHGPLFDRIRLQPKSRPSQQPGPDVAQLRKAATFGQQSRRRVAAAAVKTEEPATASDLPDSREKSVCGFQMYLLCVTGRDVAQAQCMIARFRLWFAGMCCASLHSLAPPCVCRYCRQRVHCRRSFRRKRRERCREGTTVSLSLFRKHTNSQPPAGYV